MEEIIRNEQIVQELRKKKLQVLEQKDIRLAQQPSTSTSTLKTEQQVSAQQTFCEVD